jgi:glycosyltransferase involved in cell wall biosynthesis
MRLTFPVLTLSRGGAQRMLAELANRMSAMGHEITILMPLRGVVEYEMDCRIIFTGREGFAESDFPYADVIVSNYYTTVEASQKASEAGKGIHVRLSLCYEPAFLPDNNKSFSSYHNSRNLLVLSGWQQNIIRLNHGVKGRIVPVGLNPDFYNQNFRLVEGRNLVISAIIRKPEGGFSGHREQDYLLQQLDLVKEVHPEVDIYLITPPGEFSESTMLQVLQNTGKYHFRTPGNDAELCYHYNETDIFVSSSTYDTGSLPGLEAMRCGAALVTTYAGGNMEYCVHGHNCLMSYRYENRLALDVIRLIEDRELRLRLARRGEENSMRFSWAKSTEIFQKELSGFLARSAL